MIKGITDTEDMKMILKASDSTGIILVCFDDEGNYESHEMHTTPKSKLAIARYLRRVVNYQWECKFEELGILSQNKKEENERQGQIGKSSTKT